MKVKLKVKSLSRVRLLATPWPAAYQAPLSMGFSRQECWSGVPRPQSTGSQRLRHNRSDPAQDFFACGSSAPVRVECEGGAAAWLVGTLTAPSVQEHGLPPP